MATKKSNRQLWIMLALIVAIVAVILLLPSCGGNSSKGRRRRIDDAREGRRQSPRLHGRDVRRRQTDLAELKARSSC
ncbi:MAG: hypothetical protein ACLRM8_04510 [Alistipes sp.]